MNERELLEILGSHHTARREVDNTPRYAYYSSNPYTVSAEEIREALRKSGWIGQGTSGEFYYDEYNRFQSHYLGSRWSIDSNWDSEPKYIIGDWAIECELETEPEVDEPFSILELMEYCQK